MAIEAYNTDGPIQSSDEQVVSQIDGRVSRARTVRAPNELCINEHALQDLATTFVYTDEYTGHRYCFPNKRFQYDDEDSKDNEIWNVTNPFTGRLIQPRNIEVMTRRNRKLTVYHPSEQDITISDFDEIMRDALMTRCVTMIDRDQNGYYQFPLPLGGVTSLTPCLVNLSMASSSRASTTSTRRPCMSFRTDQMWARSCQL